MTVTVTPDDYPFVHQPYEHQRAILNATWRKRAWALFLEMGTGKSKIVCDTMGLLHLNGALSGAVVVAKKGEYLNWPRVELPTHMPSEVKYRVYEFSTYKWRLASGKREWSEFMGPSDGPVFRVVSCNIEAFGTEPLRQALSQFYRALQSDVMFVVDESTCVKNHKALRSKEAVAWAQKSKMRRIMTGLPNPQSPMDVWGQSLVLNKGLLGVTNFTAFRSRYAVVETKTFGPRSFKAIVGYQRLDELTDRLRQFSHVVSKEECLDLPEKIYKRVPVELTEEQVRMIEQLRESMTLELDQGTVTVDTKLALIMKVQQIICGQVKLEDGTRCSVKNNRIQAMLDIVEEHQGKAIVWASFRQTLADAEDALVGVYGREAVASYHGGTPHELRPGIVQRLQDRSDPLRFLVANPQSAGYGLTMTTADLAIYYSNGYNLEHRLQSEDRIHRIGQKKRPVYVDIYAPGTVDEAIMTALREKRNLAELVMRGEVSLREWI